VPADGTLEDAGATLDESMLTGEPLPVSLAQGARLRSGAVNADGAFRMRTSAGAAGSTYAAIIRLTQAAAQSRAPLVRLADRWAIALIILTCCVAGAAWLISGDPRRALAVLVVATPCPLILAAPIALVAGIGRAARHCGEGWRRTRTAGPHSHSDFRQDRHTHTWSAQACGDRG